VTLPTRPTRWSYSALSTWEECPARYAYDYIYKLPSGTSAAMERGTLLHKQAEDYMDEEQPVPIPYELRKIGKLLSQYKDNNARPEQTWLLTRDWRPTDDLSAAWVKAIVDVHYIDGDTLFLRDYKSGRQYPGHSDQLELYGIMGLATYPHLQRADTGAVYIDGGFEGCTGSIIRPMLPKLIEKWNGKAIMMEKDEQFVANPGGACKWCPHAKGKGGPCADSANAGQ